MTADTINMSTAVSVQTKKCTKCGDVKLLADFHKDKNKKDGYRSSCKICCIKQQTKYNQNNSDQIKVKKSKWYQYNSDKLKEYQCKYNQSNSEKRKEYNVKYNQNNPEKCRAKDAKRRAAKLLAIPSWLTKEDYQAMEAIYTEAKRLEAETGTKHHVDHVHPLQGKLICGFHCPSNLQILTEFENCAKGNKFIPYVESCMLTD